jgi:hypothetical protein
MTSIAYSANFGLRWQLDLDSLLVSEPLYASFCLPLKSDENGDGNKNKDLNGKK